MELDLKKKIIIGIIIVAVLGILVYLYYDYANSNEESINIDVEEDNEFEIGQLENSSTKITEEESEDIIIIHTTGAIKNPRNCKNERWR